MHKLQGRRKRDKEKQSGDRDSKDSLRLELYTVEEIPCVKHPPSPRGRSHSEATFHLMRPPPRHGVDGVDSMCGGESLPRIYRRSSRYSRGLGTKLLEAIKNKDNVEVQRLLNGGANPNVTCYNEFVSACHLAALAGGDALALLKARGAQMMRTDRLGRTPLHLAAWGGNNVQIAILLNIPIDIQKKIKQHVSPDVVEEIKSISSIFHELVNVRCELGVSTPNHPDDWLDSIDHNYRKNSTQLPLLQPGWTPLHAASANVRHESVRLLLAAGSDPNVRDFVGRSALDVAGLAHYSGQYVNPNDFDKVINLLLQANPNNNINQTKILNTPLHTAVEVGSTDAITKLLAAGASPFKLNRDGLTPIHLCAKKKLREHLQVLLNNDNNESQNIMTIDAVDKDGRTVLHTAVLSQWTQGVCVALEAGANITAKANDGETPIHLAAALGNIDILSEILSIANIKNSIDCTNGKEETALVKAVENGHIDCVKRLLKDGAYITITMPKQYTVFHAAARLGHTKILKVLVDHDYAVTRIMINFTTTDRDDGKGFGPIHYAVWNNHPECVKLLLSVNAYVSLMTPYCDNRMATPLHLAAETNNVEIAKILVKFDPDTVHVNNNFGWTPLHTASRWKSREMILYLLSEGADLAALTCGPGKFKKTAADIIMNNLSKPTEFMEEVFDLYIHSNNLNLHDPNCEVTVDYSILHSRYIVPEECVDEKLSKTFVMKQTTVVEAIIGTGNRQKQKRLLVHPLIESFLYLKWRALLPFFYVIIVFYSAFVISLTVFILSLFYYYDKKGHIPLVFDSQAWASIVMSALFVLILQEVCYFQFSKRYFKQLETWIKLTTIILTLILMTYRHIGTAPDQVWYRHVATIVLFLSWVELMFLLSGFPKWGYYVPMFRKVSSNVLKILITFVFLIIGFSLSFMIQFHAIAPFENPFAALVKTMVMMTSEFDYDDLIKSTKEPEVFGPSPFAIRFVFICFLIFTAIVLMNLMVGVAVNDLQNLELIGNIKRIKKQVDFLTFLENLSSFMRLDKFLPANVLEKLIVKRTISLRPSEQTCEYYKTLPSDIRDAIFDIAQAQKQITDDKLGTQSYNIKLDEIHKAIVTNRNDVSKIPSILVEKNQDENNKKLESLVTELKKQLERTEYSIELLNKKTESIINRLDKGGI